MLNKELLKKEMKTLMVSLIKAKTFVRDDKMSAEDRLQRMAEAISEAVSKTVVEHIQRFLEAPGTGSGVVAATGTGTGIGANAAGPVVSTVKTADVGTANTVAIPMGGFK